MSSNSSLAERWERARVAVGLGRYAQASQLVWQVLNSYRNHKITGLSALISRLTVEPVPTETARVNLQLGHVTIDPGFLLDFLRTVDDLVFVILHEREHCLIRYLLDGESRTPALNLTQDAFINNHLTNLIDSPLPEEFYEGDPVYLALTRNHEQLRYWLKFKGISGADSIVGALKNISKFPRYNYNHWRMLFLPVAERLLEHTAPRLPGPFGEGSPSETASQRELLASSDAGAPITHDADEELSPGTLAGTGAVYVDINIAGDYPLSPEVFQRLSDLQGDGGRLEKPIANESLSSLKTYLVATSAEQTWKAKSVTPPSRPSNLDLMLLSMGYVPADFDVTLTRSGKKWGLFLDTSGSMREYYSLVLSLARQLQHLIERMFQFAGWVLPVDCRKDVGIKVSGGTDFEAVAQTIKAQSLKHVIVVSDNNAPLAEASKDMLRKIVQALIFVPVPQAKDGAWFDVADEVFRL